MSEESKESNALCYRCEYRAQFHERGHAPRCECGMVGNAVWSCYMYCPVKPVIQEVNDGDKRPIGAGWMISPRSHRVEDPIGDKLAKVCINLPKKRKQNRRFMIMWEMQKETI